MIRLARILIGGTLGLLVLVWAICTLFKGQTAFATLGMLSGLCVSALLLPEDVLSAMGE